MEKIFIDSDIFIDLLRGHKKRIKNFFEKVQHQDIKTVTSWINIVELYSGIDVIEKDSIINDILSLCTIVESDLQSSKIAGSIKRDYQLSLPDAIIASIVLTKNLKLFTFNKKDFQKIKGLEFFSLSVIN